MSKKKILEYECLNRLLYKPIKLYLDETDFFRIVKIGTDGMGRYEVYLSSGNYDWRENVAYGGKMLRKYYYEEL